MAYITYQYKTAECPEWGAKIQIRGQYLYLENHNTKARFQFATCPIRENLCLSRDKKNPDFELFAFCKIEDCPLLKNFPEFIE